jgi:hypothetical protein
MTHEPHVGSDSAKTIDEFGGRIERTDIDDDHLIGKRRLLSEQRLETF